MLKHKKLKTSMAEVGAIYPPRDESSESEEYISSESEEENIVSFNRYTDYTVYPKKITLKPLVIKQYTMPGYPHLGPGNPIYPFPKNELDAIAREHDMLYSAAKNAWDIYEADEIFMKKMEAYETKGIYEWLARGVGATGIQWKYAFEKRYGVLYPRFSEEQRRELDKIPAYKSMRERQNLNIVKDATKASGLLFKMKPFTYRLNQQRLGNTAMTLGRWLEPDVPHIMPVSQNEAYMNSAATFAHQLNQTDFWSRHTQQEVEEYIDKFFEEYYEKEVKYLYKEYIKNKDSEWVKDRIFNFGKYVDHSFWSHVDTVKLGDDNMFFISGIDKIYKNKFNSLQQIVHTEMMEFDEINHRLNDREREVTYDYLQSKANKEAISERDKALNALYKEPVITYDEQSAE